VNGQPLLQVQEVTKRYQTSTGQAIQALGGVSFEVAQNEFLSIVGPSGCGKSTLLKMISGVTRASGGAIRIRGSLIASQHRRMMGMVFQQASLLPWRDVLGNVLLPCEILRMEHAKARQEALALLELVGLAGFERRKPWELSGGMQQRVGLCRALVTDPELLLMDEPFAALDALTRDQLAAELLRIWSVRRKTVLFVTHNIAEAVLLSDRVLVMSNRPGRVLDIQTIDLPRPRTLDSTYLPPFQEYVRTIRARLA